MDDPYPSEPLNLVKKKKPVAVVAPSSVNEEKNEAVANLYSSAGTVDDVNESTAEAEDAAKATVLESLPPLSAFKNGYSSLLAAAPYHQTFFTNLYVNSLMTAGYLNNNYPYRYPYGGFGSASASSLPPSSSSSPSHLPLIPPPPPLNGNLTGLWAHEQRFWQMVNWHETRRKAELASSAPSKSSEDSIADYSSYRKKADDNSQGVIPVGLGEALNVTIPAENKIEFSSDGRELLPKKFMGRKLKKNHRSSLDHKNTSNDSLKLQDSCHNSNSQDKKKPHIKKPLNAFMLYMKEMRSQVVAECTLKESAAINQILGRKWHALGRDEQAKYYELARRERQLHMQLYPDWSSRANTTRNKKRKKKQETQDGGNSMKKCRARYGLDQQNQWCKPCRRKKRCIRYAESGDSGNHSEDNLGSCGGSTGDTRSPGDEDGGSMRHSVSSPGGYSVLSSLTSPSIIQASPNTSQPSPSVSLASPYMNSLQSPLTPHPLEYDCPASKAPQTPCLPLFFGPLQPPRHPVGTNPHDINNPLSVNQLTGKCIKNSPSSSSISSTGPNSTNKDSRSAIQVT